MESIKFRLSESEVVIFILDQTNRKIFFLNQHRADINICGVYCTAIYAGKVLIKRFCAKC